MSLPLLLSGLVGATLTWRQQQQALADVQLARADASALRIQQFLREIELQLRGLALLPWTADSAAQRRQDALRVLRLALAAGNAEAVLQQLDRCRARALDERLAEGALAPAADDEATTALRERLNWLYRRQRRLQDDGEPGDALTAEIQAAERALLERARRQRLAAAAAAPAASAPRL